MRRLAAPLLVAGVLATVLGLSKVHAAAIGNYDFTESSRFAWSFAYLGFLLVSAYALGLPDAVRGTRRAVLASMGATVTGALGISVVQLLAGSALLPRFVVFGTVVVLVPWYVLCSALAHRGRSSLEDRDRVLVVGSPALAAELSAELADAPEKPASVVRQIDEHDAADGRDERRPVIDAVLADGATVIVLSGPAQDDERIVDQVAMLHEHGIRVRTHSLFYEEYLGKLPVADLGRVSLFFDIGEVHRERFGRIKRIVDLVAGLVGVAVLVLVAPVVAAVNLVGNRGPLLFRQERVGRGGQVFTIVKFRSMVDGDHEGSWTADDDERVTRFGALLRRTHVDELPQMWNILRGDLSLVGPRPEQPRYVAELSRKLPFYDLRHIVRPGLTGWAQVKYGYAGDERGALEKLQYDFHYLRRQSIGFDLQITVRTIRSVLGGRGSGR